MEYRIFIFGFVIFVIAVLLKRFEGVGLTTSFRADAKYCYLLTIIHIDGRKDRIHFYSDNKFYTVTSLMSSLWDKDLGCYVVEEKNKRIIIGTMDQLRSIDLVIEGKVLGER